ncbi:MAG: SH3 domain-containing protein [Alphaproteobacteria bacterium]|nr:SH3 domain-containing protein [Alphaproteobacteria bacterium]
MLKLSMLAAAALVAVGLSVPAHAEATVSRDAPAFDQVAQNTTATITGRGVRLRAQPSPTGRVLARLARGTRVAVLARQGDWVNVRAGRRTGYVASQYVSS